MKKIGAVVRPTAAMSRARSSGVQGECPAPHGDRIRPGGHLALASGRECGGQDERQQEYANLPLYGFHAGPESWPGLWVIRVCLLPSAFMMKISVSPSVIELYAMPLPSGDQAAS
jgi:hypothetical protein